MVFYAEAKYFQRNNSSLLIMNPIVFVFLRGHIAQYWVNRYSMYNFDTNVP